MTFIFKHPKFYRIPRDKSDQVISWRTRDGGVQRAPGSGHKPQAPSSKPQATSVKTSKPQASSAKLLKMIDASGKP